MMINDEAMKQTAETINEPVAAEPQPTCDITVSEDRLAAYLYIRKETSSELSVDDIRRCLADNGIIYGIIDDATLGAYLTANTLEEKAIPAALGTAPEEGRDAEIMYAFEIRPFKAGRVTESGGMDFKDRGKIPCVKAGDLLAVKLPCIPGKPGTDVFGQAVPGRKPTDSSLLCGAGAKRSEDGLIVLASIDGHPVLGEDGKVSVSPHLLIEGDVGLETGHIDFDGPVKVTGVIESGFRVKGKKLHAQEIDHAEVEISGDIIIEKGIIGAVVQGGALLQAHHIDMSNIKAGGDVQVEKEIFGSTIVSNGICLVEEGRIVCSRIMAKLGIEAAEIGSEESKPCTLHVGIDGHLDGELKISRAQLAKKLGKKKQLEAVVENLKQKSDTLVTELQRLARQEEYAKEQLRKVKEKTEQYAAATGVSLDQAEKIIASLDTKIRKICETEEDLFAEDTRISDQIAAHHQEIAVLGYDIETMVSEIEHQKNALDAGAGISEVRVTGTIYANTFVVGPHASLVTRDDLDHVLLRETEGNEADPDNPWTITISPLS